MSDEELDAIEARANAATVGPWRILPLEGKYYGTEIATPLTASRASTLTLWAELGGQTGERSRREIEKDPDGKIYDSHYEDAQTFADAEFLANARTDVPALVAEVRRLRVNAIHDGFVILSGGGVCGCQDCWKARQRR